MNSVERQRRACVEELEDAADALSCRVLRYLAGETDLSDAQMATGEVVRIAGYLDKIGWPGQRR